MLDAVLTSDVRRTTILVTHRLSAASRADHIYVLDEGRVIEEGTHSELLTRRSLYHSMWGSRQDPLPQSSSEFL